MKVGKGKGGVSASVALGRPAVEIDFDVFHIEISRQELAELVDYFGGHIDIERVAGFVMKMSVRSQIRAVLGRRALEIHRPDQFVLDEQL